METKCIFCNNIVYRNKLCLEHYKLMNNFKIIFIKENKEANDMKNHYHNLRFSIIKQKNLAHITECMLRLIALAEAYCVLYKDASLEDKAYIFCSNTFRIKEKNILSNSEEYNEIMCGRQSEFDFRKKWNCDFTTTDGHLVRSLSEVLIDNWLFSHRINHCYEKPLVLNENLVVIPDFYLVELDIYIEYWGKYTNEYIKRKEAKIKIYEKYKVRYIGITLDNLKNLDLFMDQVIKKINSNSK